MCVCAYGWYILFQPFGHEDGAWCVHVNSIVFVYIPLYVFNNKNDGLDCSYLCITIWHNTHMSRLSIRKRMSSQCSSFIFSGSTEGNKVVNLWIWNFFSWLEFSTKVFVWNVRFIKKKLWFRKKKFCLRIWEKKSKIH